MIANAIATAVAALLRRETIAVVAKTLGVTLILLVAAWFALDGLAERWLMPWVDAGLHALPAWAGFLEPVAVVLAGLILAIGLALLLAPVTALVAGLFLDEVAEAIERRDYPGDPPGRALPWLTSLAVSVKFLGVVILGNMAALMLLLVPGINVAAFVLVNGYLLGREFFEFAAMRFRTEEEARALRRGNAGAVFLAGLVIAAWLSVPILNLATPVFAAALMVHLHKAISSRQRSRRVGPGGPPTPGRSA